MVSPLVEDFLSGKSGMLTALGPSGSGKTHTIFGCPRDPGMVPLALQHIFRADSSDSQLRLYYLSIFEIYSEKGKGEKIYDLSADGAELNMQQFTIKGLKEVLISNAREAESLVACAMTKRATAMTDSNSKSSRSQCIINIRRAANQDEVDDASNCAVISIVDLAGAEREKRTGNQGTRLLEANFINNTSMVFGLCLRSLFEHQRNPKKPLQKHFHNSLLTKYLRDYLEGKKRMALILTVKSGEEDYLDTSYLLRQASPYMKIKFTSGVEPSNTFSNKRQLQTLFTFEELKRMKYSLVEDCVSEGKIEGKGYKSEGLLPREDITVNPPTKASSAEFAGKERNHLIMQHFAKAIWKVLKQYRDKLKIAEHEIQSLREEIKNERIRYSDLEKQGQSCGCCCTCSKEDCGEAASVKVGTSFEFRNALDEYKFNDVHEISTNFSIQMKESEGNRTPKRHVFSPCEYSGSEPNVIVEAQINQTDEDAPRNEQNVVNNSTYSGADGGCLMTNGSELAFSSSQSHTLVKSDSCSSVELDKLSEQDEETKNSAESPAEDASAIHCSANDCVTGFARGTSNPSTSEDITSSQESNSDVQKSKPRADIPCELEKPKRRLLPASSTLLRDFSHMLVNDDIEVQKVNRSGKKSGTDEKSRTKGSISLMRMLKSNLRIIK